MKKILILAFLAVGLSAGAQNLRLNLYAQYAFDDKVDNYYSSTSYYDGTIKGALIWGGGLEYLLNPAYGIELSYQRFDTKVPLDYYNFSAQRAETAEFDLGANYIMIGGLRYLKNNPKVEPFFGMQLGMVIADVTRPASVDPANSDASATKFAWGLRGGVNIFPGGETSKVGLKLQAGLLSASQAMGGSLYFGTGGGGAGVSSYSTILQFTLGGGLVFKFGGAKK
jgi:hypothetical protein